LSGSDDYHNNFDGYNLIANREERISKNQVEGVKNEEA